MEVTPLEKAIFRTLVYFAYHQLPLTEREVYLWLLAPEKSYKFSEVKSCLTASSWLKKSTDQYGIYRSLKDCEDWVKEREKKYRDAERKHARARWAARYIMAVPGVEGVAVCNSLAWHATHEEGDIDFFVVTKKGRIWGARLLTTVPLRLLGMRPGEARRDPLCLSFFADEETMALEFLREGEEDWYLAYWIASLQWVGGSHALSERFFLQNTWIQKVLPHARPTRTVASLRTKISSPLSCGVPENLAKSIQERLFSKNIKERRNQSTHIVINDRMLKFHDDDRRAAISAFVRLHMQQAGI